VVNAPYRTAPLPALPLVRRSGAPFAFFALGILMQCGVIGVANVVWQCSPSVVSVSELLDAPGQHKWVTVHGEVVPGSIVRDEAGGRLLLREGATVLPVMIRILPEKSSIPTHPSMYGRLEGDAFVVTSFYAEDEKGPQSAAR
jgi:hypothetical protein